jgi:hypothetical protein
MIFLVFAIAIGVWLLNVVLDEPTSSGPPPKPREDTSWNRLQDYAYMDGLDGKFDGKIDPSSWFK